MDINVNMGAKDSELPDGVGTNGVIGSAAVCKI